MSRKILIDGRFIGVGDSIGRVVFGIIEHLLEIDRENSYSLLIRPVGIKQVKEHGFWESDRVKVEVLDIPHYSLDEQTKLLVWLNKKPYDLVYFTQFNHPILYRKPYIIIIHDLTTFGYFRYENPLKVTMFKRVMKSAVYDSKKVVADSQATKDEILENYNVDPKKIKVIYLGIDANYLRISKLDQAERVKLGNKFKKHYDLSSEYLLYTGMWKKHKNLMRLLQAFQKVHSDVGQIQLVLAGKVDKEEPDIVTEIEKINGHEIDRAKSGDPIFVAGFVPEELLSSAYAGAIAYTQSSLNEGFGLPPLEAMACGTPVVAGKISATPEVLGDAAHYFDPENIEDIAMKIEEVLMNQQLRLDLRKRGLDRIKLYSWQDNAKTTLKVIDEVIDKK
jgi:glycosyltransferase involved in cell wall biosynthesis